MGSYSYLPLQHDDSIRLLSLGPAPRSSRIQISLSEARLSERPAFEALSYTWATEAGDDSLSRTVDCDGQIIQVTENCEAALRRLRDKDTARVLWVDAVCICQADLEERSCQVGLMREVYSQASGVLIWLGEASDDIDSQTGSPVSTLFLQRVAQVFRDLRQYKSPEEVAEIAKSSHLYQSFIHEVFEPLPGINNSSLLRGLKDIRSRRWWQRIWIVQEAALSVHATVICGDETVLYSDIDKMWVYATSDETGKGDAFWDSLKQIKKHMELSVLGGPGEASFKGKQQRTRLLIILNGTRALRCMDPRDKIFGITGLSKDLEDFLPRPDYTKSTCEVYTDVAKTFLNTFSSLDLQCSLLADCENLDHPSWVPNWGQFVAGEEENLILVKSFDSTRNSETKYEILGDEKELRVLGMKFDTIAEVSHTDSSVRREPVPTVQTASSFLNSCNMALSLEGYPTGESLKGAIARTFCGDLSLDEVIQDFEEDFDKWYAYALAGGGNIDYELKDRGFKMHSSPLCTTAKGFLGSIPFAARPWDHIMLLSGGRIPLVVRSSSDLEEKPNRYRIVGPCYVHGIMHGEAYPEDEKELDWIRIF